MRGDQRPVCPTSASSVWAPLSEDHFLPTLIHPQADLALPGRGLCHQGVAPHRTDNLGPIGFATTPSAAVSLVFGPACKEGPRQLTQYMGDIRRSSRGASVETALAYLGRGFRPRFGLMLWRRCALRAWWRGKMGMLVGGGVLTGFYGRLSKGLWGGAYNPLMLEWIRVVISHFMNVLMGRAEGRRRSSSKLLPSDRAHGPMGSLHRVPSRTGSSFAYPLPPRAHLGSGLGAAVPSARFLQASAPSPCT